MTTLARPPSFLKKLDLVVLCVTAFTTVSGTPPKLTGGGARPTL